MDSEEVRHPLYQITAEMVRASKAGLPLIAVSVAVALPDICVSLISDDGRTTASRYKKWCDDNLKAYTTLTSDDMYSIRCGVLHNGRLGDLKHNVSRTIFLLPDQSVVMEDCKAGNAYLCNVDRFCVAVSSAVDDWLLSNFNHSNVIANSDKLIQ